MFDYSYAELSPEDIRQCMNEARAEVGLEPLPPPIAHLFMQRPIEYYQRVGMGTLSGKRDVCKPY